MEQEGLYAELQSLERRIRILLNEYSMAKEEAEALRRENQELRSAIQAKDNQLISFQNKIKISKIVDYVSDGEKDMPELKRKIDDYIKEIDKCILQLSK